MDKIRAFFSKIRALFSNFWKRAGETSPPPPPSSYASDLLFYWTLFKKRQTQISGMMRLKKERHELVFRIQSNIYDRAFLRKLTAKSFIVDIRPGSKYPSDERNKFFNFSIKATLKATTLVIRMCSTELLLWKNQTGSTRHPMTLCKRETPSLVFSYEYSKLFCTSYFTKQFQTTDYKGFLFA